MRKLVIVFFLLMALRSYAGPVGTIMGIEVETNGWVAKVWVEDIGTNAMFYNFFEQQLVALEPTAVTNAIIYRPNKSDTNGLKINFTSYSFAPDGTVTTLPRTVYGTKILRLPYPNDGTNDIQSVDGTNAVFRVALSDFVFGNDSSLTAWVTAGAFATTNAVTNCLAATALAVTNSSVQLHPKPIINWTWPGWNQERGPTMRLRAVGFHHYSRNRQPLACMEFIVKDEAGTITTNRVTEMSLAPTNDALPFAEYIADVDLSAFAHSNLLRCDIVGKPWVGTNTFDTRNDLYFQPTPFPAAITNFYFTNTYSAIAVVSSASPGAAPSATNTTYDLVDPVHYFSNPNAALSAIRGTNNILFGHQDCGGALVYIIDTTNAMGGTASMAGTPKVWATLLAYPGSTVIFTNHTGSSDISDRVKIENITLATTGVMVPYVNIEHLWMKNVVWNTTGTAPLQLGLPAVYVTGGRVDVYSQGFKPFSNNHVSFALLRGIDLNTMNAEIHWRTMVGCKKAVHSGGTFALAPGNASFPGTPFDYQILYNNELRNMSNAVSFSIGTIWGTTNGQAIVQNVFESTIASGSFALFTGTNFATNVVDQYNTYEGARMQYFYNAFPGVVPIPRVLCQTKNSIFTTTGEATDTDPAGRDGGRIGDWPVRWRVGSSGMVVQMVTTETSHGPIQFQNANNFHPGAGQNTTPAFMAYRDRKGAGSGTGGGNYRLQTKSPFWPFGLQQDVGLPYDIEGIPRGRIDPPGAFASGNAKKGAFF